MVAKWSQFQFYFYSAKSQHDATTATTQRAAVILLRHKWKQTETECYYSVALTLSNMIKIDNKEGLL